MMHMYEIIMCIVKKNGPISFHAICEELTHIRKKSTTLGQVKSVISRKKDLFVVEDGIVSIREEHELLALITTIGGYPGPTYKVHVDFDRKRFYLFEWINEETTNPVSNRESIIIGDIEKFKQDIHSLNIWQWQRDYQQNELILDGISWSVTLKTKGDTYESEGFECYPSNWEEFLKAVSDLVGIQFVNNKSC